MKQFKGIKVAPRGHLDSSGQFVLESFSFIVSDDASPKELRGKWRLTGSQVEGLRPFIQGQDVLDLGAGNLMGSETLVELGAASVLAVDQREMPNPSSPKIKTHCASFHQIRDTRPVVFASWIVNWPVDVEHLLQAADVVVSLSKNTDGTACGYPWMWTYLCRREVLLYIPDPRNTLTVYGPQVVQRALTGEEFAALHQEKVYTYEEAERASKGKG